MDDQAIKRGRDAGILGARRDHRRVQVLGDHGDRIVGKKGQAAGRQFVQHHAQRVQVGAAIKVLTQRQFRRQVEHGANDGAFTGQPRGQGAGQAKVHQLGRAACPRQGI